MLGARYMDARHDDASRYSADLGLPTIAQDVGPRPFRLPRGGRSPSIGTMSDDTVIPDDKDWTWVLTHPCAECGFDPARPVTEHLATLEGHVLRWRDVLVRPDVRERPAPGTWSPLEYACHVRDVLDVMASRALNIREEDTPTFPGWDQDAAAVQKDYAHARPLVVADEIVERADWFAQAYAAVRDDEWERRGRRGAGADFTLRTLGLYTAHELVHHAHDVGA